MPPAEASAPRRRRILVVVGSLDVGGVEMDILRNFPRLDRTRFDVSVYAFLQPGQLAPRLAAAGIPIVSPPAAPVAPGDAVPAPPILGGLRRLRRGLGTTWRAVKLPITQQPQIAKAMRFAAQARYVTNLARPLARHIRAQRIDIVHTFLPHAYLVGAAARSMAPGCKLVMSRVSSNFYMAEQPQYRFAETRLAHRLLDAAVCNARSIERELIGEGIAPDRIAVIRNGIDPAPYADPGTRRAAARRQLGVDADAFVMTTVANLHPYKGHADLIDALGRIRSELPADWCLLCAGRDVAGTRELLERQAAAAGLARHIRFLGNVDDVPALLAASDLHVHPSREEGFPNSVLEAMASSLPVIATRIGGLPELVADGADDGGILVPAQDPAALAGAVLRLSRDQALRARMGAANRRRVQELFSIEVSVAAYERLYDRLIPPPK